MPLREKKLGLLISVASEHASFQHGLRLAQTALDQGVQVYLYCIDEAVISLAEPQLQALKTRGLHLFACAQSAHQRNVPINELAVFSGLTIVSDLMASTDRFLAFN